MKNSGKYWILAAAATMALSGSAMAQYRIGGDGRALDANNRIGSGGVNDSTPSGPQTPYGTLGNDIVTGNVTGGRGFRGFVPYAASTAFHERLPGELTDQFISGSSGTPYSGASANNAQTVQPFYGSVTTAAPPPGYIQQPSSASYVASSPMVSQQPSDARLGETLDIPQNVLPPPGQLILPGPVDPNTQTSSIVTASPLYGVRQWNTGDSADQNFLNNNVAGQSQKLDPVTLQKIRGELLQAPQDQSQQQPNQGQDQNNSNTLDNSAGVPFESPQNQPLSNTVGGNANGINNPNRTGPYTQVAGNLSTGEGLQQRVLMAPQQQSRQYAELQKRLQQYRIIERGTESATAQNQMRQQANAQGANANANSAQPNTPMTGNQPRTGEQTPSQMVPSAPSFAKNPNTSTAQPQAPQGTAPEPIDNNTSPSDKPKPLQVHSLADGVQAKGLADLLREAEDQMKSGHYNSALEQYELAEQVAPNNPLIWLGRANAELGQSYYTRAESHFRQAFGKDQALLMGQYDLKALLGDERLTFVTKDLKEIANREQKESRPLFLLAYIAYNTGNERRAAAYLNLAEKRAGGNDPFFQLIRKYWALPTEAAPNSNDTLNK
ncbi:MAG TPA: hypothetical protein VKK61_00925 [Tepidisphaeraceae bacterium]|nr:hypothetical protein [Tepidisphaeraceae bacterium]